MVLTDASALIALGDSREPDHGRCVAVTRTVTPPMVTTLPALSEAMHVLEHRHGWRPIGRLWDHVRRGTLQINYLDAGRLEEAAQLMERYRDQSMALADATLVVLAEELRTYQVFTLDGHFAVYRTLTGRALELLP